MALILRLHHRFLVSGSTWSQFLTFLDSCCCFIHDAYPVQSRDSTAGSYLNQFKVSHLQLNTTWPCQQQGQDPHTPSDGQVDTRAPALNVCISLTGSLTPPPPPRNKCSGSFLIGNGQLPASNLLALRVNSYMKQFGGLSFRFYSSHTSCFFL